MQFLLIGHVGLFRAQQQGAQNSNAPSIPLIVWGNNVQDTSIANLTDSEEELDSQEFDSEEELDSQESDNYSPGGISGKVNLSYYVHVQI